VANAVAEHEPRIAVGVASALPARNRLQVLIVDATSENCADVLRHSYAPLIERTVFDATRQLLDVRPPIVITELVLPDGDGVEICRTAKALPRPPIVLVTTTASERVPAALIAGCDAVLLKPYSPNLLCARLGRLHQLADRATTTERAAGRRESAATVSAAPVTTNNTWNDMRCPRCGRSGATSFDFASRRRMWCACLACEHVWVDRRRE
jgi:DNA-binding response OmpR family regulator